MKYFFAARFLVFSLGKKPGIWLFFTTASCCIYELNLSNFFGLGFQYSLDDKGIASKNIVEHHNGQEYKSITLLKGNVGIGTSKPNAQFEVGVPHAPNKKEEMRIGSYYNNKFFGLGFQYSIDNKGIVSKNIVEHANGQEYKSMTFTNGNIAIGTTKTFSNYKLSVAGKIQAEEIRVHTGWADYVFKKDYQLPTLHEVAEHINEKGHLINIPSAAEVAENGIQLGEMNAKLLEKIEELTLYTLNQQREIDALKEQNKKITDLETKLNTLLQK